jgi:hypothetical protein
MNRIIDGRSTGKTSRLMLLAKENNGIIVCQNPVALRQKAYAYGITGIDYLAYEEYLELVYCNAVYRPIYIDEVEQFLKHLDNNIKGYSLSEEN